MGRPALSKLLNGGAALSPAMALRLEKTFGADRKQLLDLQATSDRERRRAEDRAVSAGAYVPDFLTIKAQQIEKWADTIDARQHLPVLLRSLIHSTGRELQRVDFPGYDNAQRHDWDGSVEADAAAPWVPAGRSGWELSVRKDPRGKAESDYQSRVSSLTPVERAKCTFVFVTARNWSGKNTWAGNKENSGDWKAVRAFDASDLEQWLETAVAPRIWLARELGIPTTGFLTIEECWDRWVAGSEPPMTDAIFAPSLSRHRDVFRRWLAASPDRPFTVAADSREEAAAFIACLLRQDDLPAGSRDQAVLFDSAETLRLLALSSSPFIPIVRSEEVERAVDDMYRRRHCIAVRPRNAVDRKADIEIDLIDPKAFANALTDMGIEQYRVQPLARESGLSPTVLRRRLSKVDAIRTPLWAQDTEVVRRHLIAMTLVGTWHAGSNADRQILESLAGAAYGGIEDALTGLLRHDDCPVWQVGEHCGVVSKIDALFAVAQWITRSQITIFMKLAEHVLSESEPSLELPRGERWMASVYGKVREHSVALRTGICETLVLLAVHGNFLFQRLDINAKELVSALIRRLLTPLTGDKLLSHEHDLPNYAEAAPDGFLTLLEEDLKLPAPALRTLLEPAGPGPFDGPSRTGVLWALERLAWSPKRLMRVVFVLAGLSRTKINDNWTNTPIGSLAAIFRSWMPQTAASLNERVKALEGLCRRFPDIGWQICIRQLEGGPQFAHSSNRPRWRNDAAGAGTPLSDHGERVAFRRKALDLAIRWRHNEETLGDLVGCLNSVPDKDRLIVWDLIEDWLTEPKTDNWSRARLRDTIRRTVLTREECSDGQDDRALEICEKLTPRDPVARNAWLFTPAAFWDSSDAMQDWREQEKRIQSRRTKAMKEIWSARGLGGALECLSAEGDALSVGHHAALCAADKRSATRVLCHCLSTAAAPAEKVDDFMRGFMWSVENEVRTHILSTSAEIGNVDSIVRLFRCTSFGEQTWRLLAEQVEEVRRGYWYSVTPTTLERTERETTELIDRLLEANRPCAAFFAVRFDWSKVETSRLRRLIMSVASVDSEPDDHFNIDAYRLSEAFDALDERSGVTSEEMAKLEFVFVRALRNSKHGIPHIERGIATSPSLFVQVLGLIYRRNDDRQDPPAWQVGDAHRSAAYELLDQVTRIPGTDDDGQIDSDLLIQWITEARGLCKEYGRAEIGDRKIGEWLSRKPSADDDTSWPCRPICEALETTLSRDMATGFKLGVRNGRGVTSRGVYDGGNQERDLAERYRARAQVWRYEYPFVAKMLDEIAEDYELEGKREDANAQVMKRSEL